VPEYLEQFDVDEREMTKFIIGTISDLDTPLTPSARGRRSLMAYFNHLSYEEIQRDRETILNATPEQIRSLAPMIRAVLDEQAICVIGNEDKIKNEQQMFASIQMLTN
jgi:hypothetical protein